MEAKTFTTPRSGKLSAPVESENEMTRIMLEAARVAVANALAQKNIAESTRDEKATTT